MKSKKGFTLIELLAIIVILAIIAVITVPIILNIIENSRKGAATDSAYGYKDAVNKWYVERLSENHNFNLSPSYTVVDGNLVIDPEDENEEPIVISFSGDKPTSGYLNYSNNTLTDGCLVFGDYAVTFNGNTASTVKGDCSSSSEQGGSESGTSGLTTYTYKGYESDDFGTSLNSEWLAYLRNDGTKNEVCRVYENGTVCIEPNRWDCSSYDYDDENNLYCYDGNEIVTNGYIISKIYEFAEKGSDCYFGSTTFGSGLACYANGYGDGDGCELGEDGNVACFSSAGEYFIINSDGTIGSYD